MAETRPPAQAMARVSVVTLPAEIDASNADRVGEDLQAAFTPGVTTIVADMTATTFCDSRGIRALVLAHGQAAARAAELRVVVPSRGVLRILTVTGLDGWLAIYPSLQEALAAQPALDAPASPNGRCHRRQYQSSASGKLPSSPDLWYFAPLRE